MASQVKSESQFLNLIYGEGFGDSRRVPLRERKTHDLKSLHQGHHEVLNLRLLGYSEREIARKTGYTPEAISLILNSRLAQLKLQQMRLARDGRVLDVAKRIQAMVPKALDIYERILSAEGSGDASISIQLQKRTADTVVKDLAGLAAPKEVRINGTMTHELLERITQRGIEAARECGFLVESVQDAEILEE